MYIKKIFKKTAKVNTDEILKACARYLLLSCTRVTTLHACYMRMQSFSANQKRANFSCTLSIGLNAVTFIIFFGIRVRRLIHTRAAFIENPIHFLQSIVW